MPPYSFTGIHHWQLKPATAVIEKGGILMSGTEEEIYMVHGKWWDHAWLQDLEPTMNRYLEDETIGEKGTRRTRNAIELLKQKFDMYGPTKRMPSLRNIQTPVEGSSQDD